MSRCVPSSSKRYSSGTWHFAETMGPARQMLAEVRVPRCDHAPDECPVRGVVEERDHLLRHRPGSFPSAVRGNNEHKGPSHPDQPLHPGPQRNTNRGPVEPVDKAASVLRHARKEHQVRRLGGGKFAHRGHCVPASWVGLAWRSSSHSGCDASRHQPLHVVPHRRSEWRI